MPLEGLVMPWDHCIYPKPKWNQSDYDYTVTTTTSTINYSNSL